MGTESDSAGLDDRTVGSSCDGTATRDTGWDGTSYAVARRAAETESQQARDQCLANGQRNCQSLGGAFQSTKGGTTCTETRRWADDYDPLTHWYDYNIRCTSAGSWTCTIGQIACGCNTTLSCDDDSDGFGCNCDPDCILMGQTSSCSCDTNNGCDVGADGRDCWCDPSCYRTPSCQCDTTRSCDANWRGDNCPCDRDCVGQPPRQGR